MVVFVGMGGSGPAAARVENARTATERRMVIFGGCGDGGDERGGCMSDLLTTLLFVERE